MVITYIIITLMLSAMFSGLEIAFISANQLVLELKKKKGRRQGKILAKFYEKPEDFLSTMLVGNNITLVIFSSLMTAVLTPKLQGLFPALINNPLLLLLLITLITTVVVLIFGEFLPKIFFRLFAEKVLYLLALPLQLIRFLLRPLSAIMVTLSYSLLRLFVKSIPESSKQVFTRLDLEKYIEATQNGSEENNIDAEMFGNALHLKKVKVKECMVPRTEIKAIDVEADIEDLKQLFIESNLSKILVYRDSIDETIAYVHQQQLLHNPGSIKELLLPLKVVPETMQVHDLMNKFISEHISLACVVDEYGGTAGVITMEDILEEIFGEIEDEHDQEEYIEVEVSPNEFILSGRLEIDYLNEKFEPLNLPEGDYYTLSGYIVSSTGSIPQQGDIIELEQHRFILELVSEKKIETIRVFLLDPQKESGTNP